MPWLSSQRCILPAAGFYTWQLTPEKYRQPFFVNLNRRSIFGIAALWDRWVGEDDDVIEAGNHGKSPRVFLAARTFSTPIAIAAVR